MSPDSPLPLSDLKVLEFTHTVMGPAAGLFLADLGAEVIRIEPPEGDRTRRLKGSGLGYYGFYNRNKKSLAIDLKTAESRPIVEKLVRRADVVIENFGEGTMERLGLGYESLSALNPRLVYCACKGFLSGPYQDRPGLDEVAQMMSGLAYMTGPPGRPLRVGASVIDVMGGMSGAMAVQVALWERQRTGRGKLVRAGLFETAVFLMGQHMVQATLSKSPIQPMSVRTSAWAVYDIFDTADHRPVFIGIVSDAQWQRFCDVFERLDLYEDPTLATNSDRIDARPRLMPILTALFQNLTREALLAKAEEARLAYTPVNRPEDLFDHPHLNGGGHLCETRLPGNIEGKVPLLPFEIGGDDFRLRTNPPALGQDSRELLTGIGYSDDDVDSLAQNKIIVLAERPT